MPKFKRTITITADCETEEEMTAICRKFGTEILRRIKEYRVNGEELTDYIDEDVIRV